MKEGEGGWSLMTFWPFFLHRLMVDTLLCTIITSFSNFSHFLHHKRIKVWFLIEILKFWNSLLLTPSSRVANRELPFFNFKVYCIIMWYSFLNLNYILGAGYLPMSFWLQADRAWCNDLWSRWQVDRFRTAMQR